MALSLRWRHFWAQRSKIRLIFAALCFVSALIALALIVIPLEWQRQVVTSVASAGRFAASLGVRVAVLLGLGIALLLLALFITLSSKRRHPYQVAAFSAASPVSVYLDGENQLPESLMKPFITYLRKYLNGRRADLLYFLDASLPEYRRKYRTLYRFGFRLVDVPHMAIGVSTAKNIVDVELALHAYQRALVGATPQHFILITADRDYLPLIYRLHALGHTVSVWAERPPRAFSDLAKYIQIEVFDLDTLASREAHVTQTAQHAAISRSNTTPEKQDAQQQGDVVLQTTNLLPLDEPASKPATRNTLEAAMASTLSLIDKVAKGDQTPERKYEIFKQLIGGAQGNMLARLGYNGSRRVEYWLEHLRAVGLLESSNSALMPHRGSTSPVAASHRLMQFLHEIAESAIALGYAQEDQVIRYQDLCRTVSQTSSAVAAKDGMSLRSLIATDTPKHTAHMHYLCCCARALGLLQYDDTASTATIHIIRSPQTLSPQTTPPFAESALDKPPAF